MSMFLSLRKDMVEVGSGANTRQINYQRACIKVESQNRLSDDRVMMRSKM